jgi:hypothetical protein
MLLEAARSARRRHADAHLRSVERKCTLRRLHRKFLHREVFGEDGLRGERHRQQRLEGRLVGGEFGTGGMGYQERPEIEQRMRLHPIEFEFEASRVEPSVGVERLCAAAVRGVDGFEIDDDRHIEGPDAFLRVRRDRAIGRWLGGDRRLQRAARDRCVYPGQTPAEGHVLDAGLTASNPLQLRIQESRALDPARRGRQEDRIVALRYVGMIRGKIVEFDSPCRVFLLGHLEVERGRIVTDAGEP